MNHRTELFVALQRVLPKHALSRLIARAAQSKRPWLKNYLIQQAIKSFSIDMSEAEFGDINHYTTFNEFFTRPLKQGVRPVDQSNSSIVSPADGAVSQAGKIDNNRLIQAKGVDYSAARLLGSSVEAELFNNGEFATIYLSPRDYHRVHMPCDGRLLSARYIPGELFSVNEMTAEGLPNLFARNERLVCHFDSDNGPFVVIFVGAMLVAGIETVWHGFYQPNPELIQETDYSQKNLRFSKGEEIGRFKFGSTVILLFPEHAMSWSDNMTPKSVLRMGEKVGQTKSAG